MSFSKGKCKKIAKNIKNRTQTKNAGILLKGYRA